MVRQPPLECGNRHTGGNRNHQPIGSHIGANLVKQCGHILGLDAEQNQLAVADRVEVGGRGVYPELSRELVTATGPNVADPDLAGCDQLCTQQPAHESLGHLTGAKKRNWRQPFVHLKSSYSTPMATTNWAGNVEYSARGVHRPASLEQLQEIVRGATRVHVVGSRHAFNTIADATELISLAHLDQQIHIDRSARTVWVPAAITYGALARQLDAAGFALHNLASLPHVSVAGAIATGTHGSGDRNGNLATAVAGLELITCDGELIRVPRGDADFDGMVVNLGALGAVTRLALEVEPTYDIRQTVFEHLSWTALLENFDEVTSSGYSVSMFTTWGDLIEQVWVKGRANGSPWPATGDLFGARAATVELHPASGMDPSSCTPQLGSSGAWWQRLTHFRLEFTPSVGNELQSEYMVARQDAVAAIDAIRGLSHRIRPLLIVGEIRTVAADTLWLSPEYARETVCLHFTWRPDQPAVEAVLVELESVLSQFDARPHWGKLFAARAEAIAALYPRLPDFLELKARLDPRNAFTNAWFTDRVSGM
jgi:alditol oxidase